MLLTIRIYVAVALTQQLPELIHRLRLRHSHAYRVEWAHVMREFKAECQANDALARAIAQAEYAYAYRDAR